MHRLVSLVFSIAAFGCVASSGDEGFSIVHNLNPGGSCAPTPGGGFVPFGTININSPNPYLLTPEISSRISDDGTQTAQRTIALRGAKVEVSVEAVTVDGVSATPAQLSQPNFKTLFAASLPPMGKVAGAFEVISVQQITELKSAFPAGKVRIQLVAKVTPFGALGGSGDTIDGVPFQYPVTVCSDCVVTDLGTCPLLNGTTVRDADANACNPFQDGLVDCCLGPSGYECPATVEPPPAAR